MSELQEEIGDANSVICVLSCPCSLKVSPAKNRKKASWRRCCCHVEEFTTIGLRNSGHRADEIQFDFTEGHKKFWDQLAACKSRKTHYVTFKNSGKQGSIAWCLVWFSAPVLRSAVRTLQNLRVGLRKRRKDKSDAPAETRGEWTQSILKIKEKDTSTCFSPIEVWCFLAPSVTKPEEGEFVVGSRASMHMLSRKDLNSAVLETVQVSKRPTTVSTASGEVQTNEEATVYVKEFDFLVTAKLLEDTPACLSLGKLCEDHGYSYEWTSGQLPHLIKRGRRIQCSTENYVPIVVPGSSTGSSSSTTSTFTTSLPQDSESTLRPAITRCQSTSSSVLGRPAARIQEKSLTKIKMRTSIRYRETCCTICLNGWRNSQRISWTKGFQR